MSHSTFITNVALSHGGCSKEPTLRVLALPLEGDVGVVGVAMAA